MDHQTRMEIISRHAEGNCNVAQRYFGRDHLFLEPLPAPDAPLAQMVLPEHSMDLMRDYVTPMVRGLIRQYADQPAKT